MPVWNLIILMRWLRLCIVARFGGLLLRTQLCCLFIDEAIWLIWSPSPILQRRLSSKYGVDSYSTRSRRAGSSQNSRIIIIIIIIIIDNVTKKEEWIGHSSAPSKVTCSSDFFASRHLPLLRRRGCNELWSDQWSLTIFLVNRSIFHGLHMLHSTLHLGCQKPSKRTNMFCIPTCAVATLDEDTSTRTVYK